MEMARGGHPIRRYVRKTATTCVIKLWSVNMELVTESGSRRNVIQTHETHLNTTRWKLSL